MNPLQERQEEAAKHHIRWRKVFFSAAIVGAIFLLIPRGLPWMSSGVSYTVMGRSFAPSWEFEMTQFLVWGIHMILALLYGAVLAPLIFRFSLLPALGVAALAGVGLYALNFLVFSYAIGNPQPDELAPLVTHLLFAVIFAANYKAISVPAPRKLIKQTA